MKTKLMFCGKSCKFGSMKNYRHVIILMTILFFLAAGNAWSQEKSNIKEFYSPWFLGGTPSVTSLMAPQSDSLNPASSALVQRVTLDLSYIGIWGEDGEESGYKGHALNFGNTIPTKIGVFSWSGHYLYSPFPIVDSDSVITLKGSFSKDLYNDFLIGAGLTASTSFDPGYALSADLGVISLAGNLGFMKDFRWGAVLQDLGYSTIDSGYPESFTFTGGVGAELLSAGDFRLSAAADLGFPGFDSVLFNLGGNLSYKDFLSLNFGVKADSEALADGDSSGFIPSAGITFTFKTDIKEDNDFLGIYDRGWNRSEVNIQSGFGPVSEDLWAAGLGVNIPLGLIDRSAPVIEIDISGSESDENQVSDGEENNTSALDSLPTLGKASLKNGKNITPAGFYLNKNGSGKTLKKIVTVQDTKDTPKTGTGDRRFPGARVYYYISPNNDGKKDDLTFPINISDSRYIHGYSFQITDSNGNIVREIRNKEKRIENQGFSGFFDRLFSVKSGIEVPESFRWDGLDNNGEVAADGLYFFHVEAWDDNGNVGSSEKYAVVLDSTPPDAQVDEPVEDEKIFSPNEDGNKDTVKIDQSGSTEDLWTGYIKNNEGETVRNYRWVNKAPEGIIWDGKNDSGILVADGVYSYQVESVDRAGNSFETGFSNIIKNTEETPISLTIDKSYFSPNGDLILDSLVFEPGIPVKTGIVGWNITVENSNGIKVRAFSGSDKIPEEVEFDGRDSSGIRLEEGRYRGRINVVYRNGNNPESESPFFNLDVTAPEASVKSSSPIFSPNGDGQKDVVTFYQDSSVETSWTGTVRSEDGKIITEFNWLEAAGPALVWDGSDSEGRLCPDGVYNYSLNSIDRAGNPGKSNIVEITLDTEETPVILTTDIDYFSPNSDGRKDSIALIPEIKTREGIDRYTLEILDKENNIVRTYTGKGNVPEKIVWNGINSQGRSAEDGVYRGRLMLFYDKGNEPVAVSRDFVIDTVFPEIALSAENLLFSPNGDNRKDTLEITQETSTEDIWKAEIIDAGESAVREFNWSGNAENISWSGTDNEGNRLGDGTYTYRIYSEDKAGNRTEKNITGINIDTKPTSIFVTAGSKYLSPTGNGKYEEMVFNTIVNNREGLESWTMNIVDEKGSIGKRFSGERTVPSKIIWNGLNEDSRLIEGVYHAVFTVNYAKGNRPEAKSSAFRLDVSAPVSSLSLNPVPFSPDNDGVDDEVKINISVDEASGIKKWSLNIYDPENRPFISFGGEGTPADRIIWNGISSNGELVYAAMDYPVQLVTEDILGNKSVISEKIPVDVLVVREGDVLKIKIANIVFKKNSAELLADTPEVIEQNKFILNRVSELLKKYSTYKITIEGHAVLTRWNDPEAAKLEEKNELQPLSEQRALTVLNYLAKLGVPTSRMDSVGMGGTKPLVPHSDLDNRWKNRRVEFILWKE